MAFFVILCVLHFATTAKSSQRKLRNEQTSTQFCTNAAFKRRFHVRIQTTMFTVAKSMQTVSWTIVPELQHPEAKMYRVHQNDEVSVQNFLPSWPADLTWPPESYATPAAKSGWSTLLQLPPKFWNDLISSQIFDCVSSSTVKEAAAEEEGDTKGNQLFVICDLLQHIVMFF